MSNILITGSDGMLGNEFKAISQLEEFREYHFEYITKRELGDNFEFSNIDFKPDVIIHCAAIVDADYCENFKNEAAEVILGGTKSVINFAKLNHSKVVYPQSFLIFDGNENNITEQTIPNPLSTYGQLKYKAELEILASGVDSLIIRMAGFFGGYEKDKNFVGKFYKELLKNLHNGASEIYVGERVWQPTYTYDLAYNTMMLIKYNESGVYNMGAQGSASFFEVAEVIVDALGVKNNIKLRKPVHGHFDKLDVAKRPSVGILSTKKLKNKNLYFQRDWIESLKEYLSNSYFNIGDMMYSNLFQDIEIPGVGKVKNRFVMSAMTRGFSPDHLATDQIKDYYAKRARGGVGIILTEGIVIDKSGDGYNNVPHISNSHQANSWIPVVNTVHRFGSKIIAQLWHCGRISHTDYTVQQPVSSTNKQASGINRQNGKEYSVPRQLETSEFESIFEMYAKSAKLALDVNFDAIQIHMGHGYLVDQFLDGNVNDRTDDYGGSPENRCRFAFELLDYLLKSIPSDKIIIRISPSRYMNGIYEWPDLDLQLNLFIKGLNERNIKFLDVSCANSNYFDTSSKVIKKIKSLGFSGFIFGGASLSPVQSNDLLCNNELDFVTWGRMFIANPDFVERVLKNSELIEFQDSMRETLD